MTVHNYVDSARIYGLETMPFVLENKRPATVRQHRAGLTETTPEQEVLMAFNATNARDDSAQVFEDPIVIFARIVNDAAELERRLAARKALRPARSAAARLGWETRRA